MEKKRSKIKPVMACKVSDDESIDRFKDPYLATHRKVTYWFNILNKEIFGNKLTRPKGVFIRERLQLKTQRLYAQCCGYYDPKDQYPIVDLQLSDKFRHVQHFISVLAHEMIHMFQWEYEGSMNHGKKSFFKPWKDKFAKFGIKLQLIY
jgi:hypothetical protein